MLKTLLIDGLLLLAGGVLGFYIRGFVSDKLEKGLQYAVSMGKEVIILVDGAGMSYTKYGDKILTKVVEADIIEKDGGSDVSH